MTMHLARGLSTLNTRIKKSKPTKAKIASWKEQHRIHNKEMKRLGLHKQMMTFDEYVLYIHGKLDLKVKDSKPLAKTSEPFRRETQEIPSYVSKEGFAPCTKKEQMQYSGERKLVGIAMMHKSNLVPVFADDDDRNGSKQATEIAQMRRN